MLNNFFERTIAPIIILGLFILGVSLGPGQNNKAKTDNLVGYFLDVGQGDAVLLERQKEQILVDGGPDEKVLTELGRVMPPFDRTIETVILTHPHADHAVGLISVLDRYQVERVYLTGQKYDSPEYRALLDKIKAKNIPVMQAVAGAVFEENKVRLNFLWPSFDIDPDDLNSGSAAMDVGFEQTHWLLLGDLPEKYQEGLSIGDISKFDVIKIAHHGSKNGISTSLLEKTKPTFAVISVGANNDYGHPSSTTLARLRAINVLRTDRLGTIELVSDGKNTSLFR